MKLESLVILEKYEVPIFNGNITVYGNGETLLPSDVKILYAG